MKFTRTIAITLLLSASLPIAKAQDFSAILNSIEQNSLGLEASRLEALAAKQESRLENTLDDPEIGYNFLFGSGDIGNRHDVSISQTFDFPTVYVQRAKLVKEMKRVADLRFLSERQQLLVKARMLCIEVVYCNAMLHHLNKDLQDTGAMAEAYERLYQQGEATEIERRKARQALLLFEAQFRSFNTMRGNYLDELQCLNGGQPVEITDSVFVHTPLASNFDQWLSENIGRHPEVMLAEGECRANRQSVKVAKNALLPKVKVGYMGEFERDDHYQGLSFGLSLPLWSGAKRVKARKAYLDASEMRQRDTMVHLTVQLRSSYGEALECQETYQQFVAHLTDCDNTPMLKKSLEAGQITLLTYLQERQYVHEMHERMLEAERDLELKKAELMF